MDSAWIAAVIARVMATEERLAALPAMPAGRLTTPDPQTGERWEPAQVLGHIAEFIPYWLGQASLLIRARTAGDEPPPFGRTQGDPDRIARIEEGRQAQPEDLQARLNDGLRQFRDFMETTAGEDWLAAGVHPRRGEMTVQQVVREFIVDHLEQHVAQLEGLASP